MFRASLVLLIATGAGAQTSSPETQALQALVAEIRQLRLDLQTTTITTQRVQVVLYRLQSQTALVTRAASHLDSARSSLGNAQSEKKNLTDRMAYVEEALKNTQETERKNQQEIVAQMKAGLARMAAEEQRLQAIEIDAATQLRMEQAKLADLQDQLERLDKLLDSLTRK